MNLAEEEKAAEYVEILGDLKTKGVLTDGEFRQLKALVLETNDHGISTQLLSLLDKFWSQRTKGYLTDDDFDKKKGHLLDNYLRGNAPTSSVSSSYKGKEPTKRKSCSRYEQTKKRVNPTRTAPSRDRSLSGEKTLLRDKERSLSLGGGSVASAGREHAVEAFASPEGESQELANVESGSTEYSSEEEKGTAEQGVLKCFNHAFWAPTHRFDVPGNGYCKADVPLSFVDSTVELLEKSEPRVFPPFVGAVRPLAASKQNYFRQGKMYGKLKKVMIGIGEGGEERVFRATDAEICRTVMEVADGRLSLEEYIAEVKRIRGRESVIGEKDDRESSA